MNKPNKAYEKRIEKGAKLYQEFIEQLSDAFGVSSHVSTPRTNECEKYALLARSENLKDILYGEMMREYLTNHRDYKIFAENGALYQIIATKVRL